jgi:hypothetical protein
MIPSLMFLGLHFSNRTMGTIVVASADIYIERKIELSRKNSENIPLFVRDLFNSIGQPMTSIELIGVVVGPGALTPLRLSVATAQTFGLVLNVPVIELSAFEVHLIANWALTQVVVLEGRGTRCLVRGFSCAREKNVPLFGYIEQDISDVIRFIHRFNVPIGVVTNTQRIADQLCQACPSVDIRYTEHTGHSMIALIKQYQWVSPRSNLGVDYAYSPV